MAVDLKKNKDSLVQAYQKVFDAQDETNWAVYGYEGQTNYLTVVETGNGGIEELADELSSGRMMYGYCQVTDPNTSLPKYVLIHWTGEGVPENIKLKYTSHLRDVQNFIRSIHITIPARNEDDIDLNDIMKRVAKSSGANYSFHKEKAKPEESPAPVGTDYKRVIPTKEINISRRDQFWAEAEKVEIQRQNEEKAKSEAERKVLEEDRKNREIREAKEREKRISEHMKEVQQQRLAEKKSEEKNKEIERQNWEKVQRESSIDEEERGHRSDQMRRERATEAAHIVSSTTSSARNFFKQKSMERPGDANSRAPPPPRKLKHGFGPQSSEGQQDAPGRKQPIQLPDRDEGNEAPPSKPARQPEPEPEPEPYSPEPEPEPEPEPAYEPEPVPQAKVLETTNLMKQSLPPRQDSDVEDEEDQNWDEPPAEDFTFRENRVPSFHEDYSAEQQHAETQSHRVSASQHFIEQEEDQQEVTPAVTEDQGLCARALYDYQASDDTEITFDPDDIITNIEQIDAGWWQGFSPDGSYGMFPANFVELIN